MSLANIVGGDYGQPIELTFIDEDTDGPADISGYSATIQMLFVSPAGGIPITKTAVFKTDGTDGIIRYVTEQGFITAALIGMWNVRGQVKSASAQLTTVWHEFKVIA